MTPDLRERLAGLRVVAVVDHAERAVVTLTGESWRTILSELDKAGMAVVPREPSEEMIEAADICGCRLAGSPLSSEEMTAAIWAAMISSHANKGESDG